MPSRFLRCEMVRAEAGGSVVGLAAYIARARRYDHSGSVFNFAHRAGELVATGFLLPEGAPDWASDPAAVWREAERAEQTIDRHNGERRWKTGAQLARHMTIALPREVTAAQRQAMLLAFIAAEIQPQRHGVVLEWAIHADDNNPHAHLLISTRCLSETGFGKKARAMNPGFASRGKVHFVSDGDDWDKRWASFQTEYFAREGIAAVVRERQAMAEAHYTRGQIRSGAVCRERDAIAEANAAVAAVRLRDPEVILETLTAHKAVFTARDLRRALDASGLEGKARAVLDGVLQHHPETLALVDARGETVGWTTRTARTEEAAIIATAARIVDVPGRPLGAAGGARLAAAELSDEQRQAAARMTGRRLAIVIGRAGTGKSHTLQAVRRAFEAEGRKVIGLAPTNAVVGDLRRDGYRRAATLHRELGALARDPGRWDRDTVVMVDEAAMVDNAMLAKLLAAVEQSGARLILAGDDRQFASVARGGMFSDLVARHGAAELVTVRRQRQAYQAKASADFARGDILAALEAYDRRGQIVWCDSLEEARAAAVAAQAAVSGPGFLYASTNHEVEALNQSEQQRRRQALQDAGEHIVARDFKTVRGEVSIAPGERVQFYRSDRAIGVATSEFGTVRRVTASWLEVSKDDGTVIGFDPNVYDQWGLGYSGTGYKGQGKTQPRVAAVYDNPYAWDARAAYVIGTRHRDHYQLFVSRDLAPDLEALAEQILRRRDDRGSSLRYLTAEEYQDQKRITAASETVRAALATSRRVRAAKAARARERQPPPPMAAPQPRPERAPPGAPSSPPPQAEVAAEYQETGMSPPPPMVSSESTPQPRPERVSPGAPSSPPPAEVAAEYQETGVSPPPPMASPQSAAQPRPERVPPGAPLSPPPQPAKPRAAPPWPAKIPPQVFASRPVPRQPKPEPRFGVMWRKLASVFSGVLPSRAKVSAPSKAAVARPPQPARPMMKPQAAANVTAKPRAAPPSAPKPGQEVSAPSRPIQETRAAAQPRPERAPSPAAVLSQPVRPMVTPVPEPQGAQSSPPPELAKPRAAPLSAPKPGPEVSAPSRPIQETRAAPQPRPERAPSPAAVLSQPVRPMVTPVPEPQGAQSSPPPEPAKPRSPPVLAEATAPAEDVAEALSRHGAVFEESVDGERQLAMTWQGSAAEEEELARLITRAWQAACAIVRDPALLAAFREQNPEQARHVKGFAKLGRDQLIARVRRQMPQPSPEPEPEPEPEPPGMRM